VRFAVALPGGDAVELEDIQSYANDDFASFDDALSFYLERASIRPRRLALAFAGAIKGNAGALTNRPSWRVDGGALARRFGLDGALVVNDFAAAARGVVEAPEDAFVEIKPGVREADAPVVVGGPGTGFGTATVVPWMGRWRVLPGEGGHRTYAPQTPVEWALAEAVRAKLGHVSVEIVAAGKHAETVREALFGVLGEPYERLAPDEVLARAAAGDRGSRAYCELRAAATMSAMGDAALLVGARGGVVLMGGVAERLVDYFRAPAMLDRFIVHGPMSDYLRPVPVRLAAGPHLALIGAARIYLE
jgi:glucokinase